MKQIVSLLLCVAVLGMSAVSKADPGQSLISHVAVSKAVDNKDRFVFSVCQAGRCETLGSKQGYTAEQIEKFNGNWQMLGAVGMGLGEGVVVLYLAGSGVAIGAGYMSFGAIVGGGTIGAAAPLTAIHYLKSINPVEQFRNGSVKSRMESAIEDMIENGEASVVIYKNTDLKKTLKVAKRLDAILKKI